MKEVLEYIVSTADSMRLYYEHTTTSDIRYLLYSC